jgi:hypothetical protein
MFNACFALELVGIARRFATVRLFTGRDSGA